MTYNKANTKPRVSLIKCETYHEVEEAVIKALENIDCFKMFKDKKVLLKVNLNKAQNPDRAVNTHPEFVRAVVRIIKNQGGSPIIGESSAALGFTGQAFKVSGIEKVAKEENVRLVNFDAGPVIKKRINGRRLKSIYVAKDIEEADLLVSLPKLKYHTLTLFTGALKNQLGLLVGGTKCGVHELAPRVEDLSQAIVDINLSFKFDLSVMDGVVGLEYDNKTEGSPVRSRLVAASTDLVALDSVCSYIIGLKPQEVFTNKIGQQQGLGVSDLSSIEIIGNDVQSLLGRFKMPGFSLKRNPVFAKAMYGIRRKIISPVVIKDVCQKCGKCAQACPVSAIELKPYPVIAKGKCIYCYCCYENCPQRAMKLTANRVLKPLLKSKLEGMDFEDLL
ncbi:MAG: DUF362 domain-containing protein [Candidatus Omnitrophica bacterium]|nr:DUF362 domain-containing protein [Candidatus Omnitrophota bacterium]